MGSAPSTTASSSVDNNVPLQTPSGSTQDQHNESLITEHPEVNKSQNGGDENNQLPSEKSTNTSDHLSIERQQALSIVTEQLQKLQSHQHERTTEGKLTQDQLMALTTAVQSYFPLDANEAYTMIHAFRIEVAKKAIAYETIQIVCQYCVEYLDNNHPGERDVIVLQLLMGLLHNFSDQNPDVCKVIMSQDTFMKTIKEKLTRFTSTPFVTKQQQQSTKTITNEDDDSTNDETSDKLNEKNEVKTLVSIFGTLHNISQVDDLVQSLREVGILEMTKPFLDSPNDEIRLTCLGILANIVNEDECDILVTNDNLLNFLMHVLEKSMKNENRQCRLGYSSCRTTEFALMIRMIARNDKNKKSLAAHGVIPLLIMLAEGKDVEEQREAVGALWSLSFDKDNKHMMINDEKCKAIDTFERLMSSEDKKVKDICRKALWTMRKGLVNSKRYESLGLQFMSIKNDEKEDGNTDGSHVMISYNSKHRPLVADIHKHIQRRQLNVWMDVHDMHGSTIDAMAKAVENAEDYGSSIESVQNWTKDELGHWLERNQLNGKSFRSLQGSDIAFLCVLVNECPELFYQTIRNQLGVKDIHTMARLRLALNALNI